MMILNQRDYRRAKARREQLRRFTGNDAVVNLLEEGLPHQVNEARKQTLAAELLRIEESIDRYESITRGNSDPSDTQDALELGLLPILVRLSRGLSQKDLAEILGMREQQVQRYEKDRYATISLQRYQQILDRLEVEVEPRLVAKEIQAPDDQFADLELSPELLKDLRKRAWVNLPRNASPNEMRKTIGSYVRATAATAGPALNRRTRSNAKPSLILDIWLARILERAAEQTSNLRGKFNIADTAWLGQLVRLSVYPDGPVRALRMLNDHGIAVVVEPHLPKTLLDGAAMVTKEGIPIVALTARHDRLDNFWFTLMHEMGHIYLHFRSGLEEGFLDDDLGNQIVSDAEREADEFARNQLIPEELWKTSTVRFTKSPDVVEKFARRLNIHPAIVAGRIRSERNYSLFSDLVGVGQVRSQLLSVSS